MIDSWSAVLMCVWWHPIQSHGGPWHCGDCGSIYEGGFYSGDQEYHGKHCIISTVYTQTSARISGREVPMRMLAVTR